MIKLGDSQELIVPARIRSVTFHPFRDRWWVVYAEEGKVSLLTVDYRRVAEIRNFDSLAEARTAFLELAMEPTKETECRTKT